jgi:hypothetical protein
MVLVVATITAPFIDAKPRKPVPHNAEREEVTSIVNRHTYREATFMGWGRASVKSPP